MNLLMNIFNFFVFIFKQTLSIIAHNVIFMNTIDEDIGK